MSAPVFVADTGALSQATTGALVRLDGAEARHAIAVTRIRIGERVDLVDGLGRRATGPVAAIDGSTSLGVLVESIEDEPPSTPRITVVQALLKGDRGVLAVDLLTEIGVDEIVPWSATNCVVVWKGERADRSRRRWIDAALSASKQSRRARFPVVAPLATTAEVVARIEAATSTAGAAIVLHESATAPLGTSFSHVEQLLVVVGPEGGLTDAELAAFESAGAATVRIGPTVLRASSAGMAAVAAVLSASSRWSTRP